MSTPWNESGVKGARRFLDKVWRLFPNVNQKDTHTKSLERLIHQTIDGVETDIESLKFNTAIAKMMTLVNEYQKVPEISRKDYETLLRLLYPIAPHLCEEIWQKLGHEDLMVFESYPVADPKKMKEEELTIVISINGKVKDKVVVDADISKQEMETLAKSRDKIKKLIDGKQIVKVIVVPKKLVNIVIK